MLEPETRLETQKFRYQFENPILLYYFVKPSRLSPLEPYRVFVAALEDAVVPAARNSWAADVSWSIVQSYTPQVWKYKLCKIHPSEALS